jgi:predicted RNA polymerase sigma factor
MSLPSRSWCDHDPDAQPSTPPDRLLEVAPSPVAELNRAVAICIDEALARVPTDHELRLIELQFEAVRRAPEVARRRGSPPS